MKNEEICRPTPKPVGILEMRHGSAEVDTPNLKEDHRSEVPQRLVQEYDGLFQVVKRVGAMTYRLQLSKHIKIHLTFMLFS